MTTTSNHARTGSAPKHEVRLIEDADVGALARPRKGRKDYHCKDTPGLMVRVSSASAVFIVRKRGPRLDNKPGQIHKLVIGHHPAMTLETAKAEANRIVRLIDKGADPTAANTATQSLGEAWAWAQGNRHLKPSTLKGYRDLWNRHLARYAGVAMVQVTSEWVKSRMDEARGDVTKDDGVTDANRLRSLLSMICSEWCPRNNATHPILEKRVRKAVCSNGLPRPRRTNKLTVDQARAYAGALERYAVGECRTGKLPDNPYAIRLRRDTADFLILNMRVGLRKSNGIGLQWPWINMETAKIAVPASETKTKRGYEVDVPTAVLAMLKRRHDDPQRHAVYVFPGRHNADKPMTSPTKAHEAVLKLAGLPEDAVTIHDMRRTLGSAMIANGASVIDVRDQLGHANVATTSIYLSPKGEGTVRKSLDRASAAFDGGHATPAE